MDLATLLSFGVECVAGKLGHQGVELGFLTSDGPVLTPEGELYVNRLRTIDMPADDPAPAPARTRRQSKAVPDPATPDAETPAA